MTRNYQKKIENKMDDFFSVIQEDKNSFARVGQLKFNPNPKITITTPMFMPVGTRGSVKAIWQDQLEEIGYRLILGNTYHLYLRPGEIIKVLGGLKKFMSWKGAILTDSGGFQVYSLSNICKFREDGILFSSYWDGSKHIFTPKSVIDFQFLLDSDILMVLDDCPPANSDAKRIRESLKRTHNWAKFSKNYFEEKKKLENQPHKKLFGIIQGGIFEEFRLESIEYIQNLNFDGIAVGGLSVGEKKEDFNRMIEFIGPKLQKNKIHYLMGVGKINDLLLAMRYGFDIFDCVLPTRNARHGNAYTHQGKINIKNSQYKLDNTPIDFNCECKVCKHYTKAYIRHLIHTQELLGYELLTYHNLYFYFDFFQKIQKSIKENSFKELYKHYLQFSW